MHGESGSDQLVPNIPDKTKTLNNTSCQLPFVTIVVPCYNEEVWIYKLLHALEKQTYPKDRYEVIIVDNNSCDKTQEIVKRHPFKLLIEKQRSSYKARNRGVRNAIGEYIAFIDADCLPNLNWIENLIAAARQLNCYFVAGKIENNIVKNNFANLLLSIRRSPERRRDGVINNHTVSCGNMLVAASLFNKCGLFNTVISGSDNEFSKRVSEAGEKIAYAENAVVSHQCDLTNLGYLKRAFRIRYGQELNNRSRNYLNLFWKNFLSIPWRPGILASVEIIRPHTAMKYGRVINLWIYMWIERWFAYFGAVVGAIIKVKIDKHNV